MKTGSVRRDPSGRGWIADVSINGHRRTARAASKVEAEQRRRALIDSMLAGEKPRPPEASRRGEFTLEQARTLSLRTRWKGKASERVAAIYSQAVLNGLGPDLPVADVTAPMVREWRERLLLGGNTPSTCNKKVSALTAMLRDACDWGHLAAMPPIPQQLRAGGYQDRIFHPHETAALCQWFTGAGHQAAADLLVFLLDTACRWGEAERLKGRDVDLAGRKITFWRTKNLDPRTIPLTARALEVVGRNMPPVPTLSVWPYTYGQYVRLFDRALAATGLQDTGLHIHITRHTAATRMAEAGVSQAQLMAFGGWRSLQAVRRYMHIQTEGLSVCAQALEKRM